MDVLISTAAIGVIASLFMWWLLRRFQDRERWVRAANAYAKKLDLPARPDVIVRMARHLRVQDAVSETVVVAMVFVAVTWLPSADNPNALAWVTLSLAVIGTAVGVAALFPAWNDASGPRVAHLVAMRVTTVFTRVEWIALAWGQALAVAGGVVALTRTSADGVWWWVWSAGMMLNVVGCAVVVWLTVRQPSRATDDLELQWDDALRHNSMRGAILGTVWVVALFAVIVNYELFDAGNLIPIYGIAAAAFAIGRFFRRGDTLWRRAWDSPRC